MELNRLNQFITDLNMIRTEEQIWDVWLYKVQDKGYEEFKNSVLPKVNKEGSSDDKTDIERAVKSSRDVISEFN